MAENRDTHRLAVCWDDPDGGKLDLKEFYQYCWDTKGIIADAINEAADGIVSVSQHGDYKKYADAIRKMYKRIWSSADDTTAPLKCIITNDDLQYGKWHNYGYVDINEISAKRFGDYDKYYAASSFYVQIENPPVYVDDGHVEGSYRYDANPSTADISGLASADVASYDYLSVASAVYSVLSQLFPDAHPDTQYPQYIYVPELGFLFHVTISMSVNWVLGDDPTDYEPGGPSISSGVSKIYGLYDSSKKSVIIFTDNGTQIIVCKNGDSFAYAGSQPGSAFTRNYGYYPEPEDISSKRTSYHFLWPTNISNTGVIPWMDSGTYPYGIFAHKEGIWLNETREMYDVIDMGKLHTGPYYEDRPLFSKCECQGKTLRYLGHHWYWEVGWRNG